METPSPSPPTVPDSQPVPDVPEPSPPPVPEPGAPEVPEPEIPDDPDVPAPELPIDDPGAPEIPDSPGLRDWRSTWGRSGLRARARPPAVMCIAVVGVV